VVKWLRARSDWMVMRLENAQKRTPAQASRDRALGMEGGAPLAKSKTVLRMFIMPVAGANLF
jgi:hypothetical protein